MPHYDVASGYRLVDPDKVEEFEMLEKAKIKLHATTWAKCIRTVDGAIDSLKPSKNNLLVWTKSGAAFGYKSSQPTNDINHLWEATIKVFGETKESLMFVGSLLYWRISLRKEQWFSYPSEKGTVDHDTGKAITERSYWINNDFKVEVVKDKKTLTAQDLVDKFSKRHP